MLRILTVIGTRPEAIKLAPLVHELRRNSEQFETVVCLSGQHRELVVPLVEYFELRPDVDLALMTHDQTAAGLTAVALAAFHELIGRIQPDWIVVQGDTATTLAASMSAFLNRRPLLHVEAGLRTGSLDQPWPEEFNRRVTTLAASRHAAPTQHAADQLISEGVDPSRVRVTGNTVIDALEWTREREASHGNRWLDRHPYAAAGQLVVVTAHRRENLGKGLHRIAAAIDRLAAQFPEVTFLWPVHPNPQVTQTVRRDLAGRANVRLVEPLEYAEFVWLMDCATLLISDSGGIQEEAPTLRKPLLVLREVTERPEAIESGVVELVGTATDRIVAAAGAWLSGQRSLPTNIINPFGVGDAAAQIVRWLAEP